MLAKNKRSTVNAPGFTIVELLVVIVVIGILAGITVAAFSGVRRTAVAATLQSDLSNGAKTLETTRIGGSETFPSTDPGLKKSAGTTLSYIYSSDANRYCLSATSDSIQGLVYHIDSRDNKVLEGPCTLGPWSMISAGNNHTCGIASGKLFCWGRNQYGQLGDGTTTSSNTPIAVVDSGALSGRTVTYVNASGDKTCAVASGQAFCWGYNLYGQLGNNSTTTIGTPVAVSTSGVLSGRVVTAIAGDGTGACALADGLPFCWGQGGFNSLGNGTTTTTSVPVAVTTSGVLSGKTLSSIYRGNSNVCVLSDGKPYCWGNNSNGEFGNGTTTASSVPIDTLSSSSIASESIVSMAFGQTHVCVALQSGSGYCWGSNGNGEFGNGTTTASTSPAAITMSGALSGKTILSVSGGAGFSCSIASDTRAYCWGTNTGAGQLGRGNYTNSTVPVAVVSTGVLSGKALGSITTGSSHTCTLADGIAYCWGIGSSYGNLGHGVTSGSNVPVQVISPI